jgi:hypothetical protein
MRIAQEEIDWALIGGICLFDTRSNQPEIPQVLVVHDVEKVGEELLRVPLEPTSDTFFLTIELPHFGQTTFSSAAVLNRSSSKGCPQFSHANS